MTGAGPLERPGGARFRADVEGLRAVAVLLVMLYHAGLPAPTAGFLGVDVFFVVSGFVITAQLLREIDREGSVSLVTFYGRRAKRLLPASAVVILVTALGAWLLAPAAQWRTIATDLLGSSLYVVNWVFAGRAVDYLAEDVEPSPVQHYWSLAVEEQFYLIWPLIVLLLLHGALRGNRSIPARRALTVGLSALIVIPSFAWALHLTQTNPERAFFVTTTRLWELGVGALVALGATRWRTWPTWVGACVAWAGLGSILLSAFVMDARTPWPAPGALGAVLGTAAVVIGGFSAGRAGPVRVLGRRPMVWVGGLSYSLYLWHWTVLALATWRFGPPDAATGCLLMVLSVIPAWLSFRLVERPIRHARRLNQSPLLAIAAGLMLTLLAAVASLLLALAAATVTSGGASGGDVVGGPPHPSDGGGPVLRTPGRELRDGPPVYDRMTPSPLLATEDVPDLYAEGCQVEFTSSVPVRCESGDPDGDIVIGVVGDSKIAQWVPAIDRIAQDRGWKVVSYTKSGCSASFATVYDDEPAPYPACEQWSQDVLEELREAPPTLYLTSGRRELAGPTVNSRTPELMAEGYASYWSEVVDLGTTVVALSDTPGPRLDVPPYQCVDEHPDSYGDECTWPYERALSSQILEAATEQVDGATFLDMDPWVCPEGTCSAALRNIVTYRQGSHITATYAVYLSDVLEAQLVPLVEASGTLRSP